MSAAPARVLVATATGSRARRGSRSEPRLPDEGPWLEEEFGRFHARWAPQVHRWASARLFDLSEADDVTQQVFLAVWQRHGTYLPDRGTAGHWLYGITTHKINDMIDGYARRQERARSYAERMAARPLLDTSTEQINDRLLLGRAMAVLPPEQRTVLDLA